MRLIDADALMDNISKMPSLNLFIHAKNIEAAIDETPTIDAEPVTYCNMCKHYETDTGFCQYHGHGMHWDDFCSCGAKIQGENECSDG